MIAAYFCFLVSWISFSFYVSGYRDDRLLSMKFFFSFDALVPLSMFFGRRFSLVFGLDGYVASFVDVVLALGVSLILVAPIDI
jgi:hypothetical protein